jgi:hypothetical protein
MSEPRRMGEGAGGAGVATTAVGPGAPAAAPADRGTLAERKARIAAREAELLAEAETAPAEPASPARRARG